MVERNPLGLRELVLYQDGDILLTAENEDTIIPGLFVHNALLSPLTPSKYKKAKEVWASISEQLLDLGVQNIYAVPLEPDNEKWTERFGFKYTGITLEGYKLYKYKKES